MIELNARVEQNGPESRDPLLASAQRENFRPSEGAARLDLNVPALAWTVENSVGYRVLSGPGIGAQTSTVSGCSIASGLAPGINVGGSRLTAQVRGGVTASGSQCAAARSLIVAGVRVEQPIGEARATLFATGSVSGRGAGALATRRDTRRLELGFELRADRPTGSEQLAGTLFHVRDNDARDGAVVLGAARQTGISLSYERSFIMPAGPGDNLNAVLSGEAQASRSAAQAGRAVNPYSIIARLRLER